MQLALYAPGLGYYAAGATKFGRTGDFITAPELTPLFGATLARFTARFDEILEIGPGSGALAESLLEAHAPRRYYILEVSAELRERARARLARFADRIVWLERLPERFRGLIIGNEVLDAMPVRIARVEHDGIDEAGVTAAGERFDWSYRPADATLRALLPPVGPPYTVEVAPAAWAFVRTIAALLEQGVALFIDYGFPTREFYHPDRSAGTLMCHYRHQVHADPLVLPGLQDITAHVDFSAIAEAARAGGCELLGYTSQASFLIDCGITEVLGSIPPEEPARYLPAANAVQQLLSPAEMGELFKVIAFGRGFDAADAALLGFRRDRQEAL